MAASVAFCLLGPLTVRVDDVVVRIPRGKQRVILAALLLSAGQTVTADRLAELLWGPAPPSSAGITLQNYVKRLRQALGAGRDRIATQPGGYRIEVDPGELDLSAMGKAVAAASRAARAGAWPGAARQASAALAFWCGKPLCDIDSDALTTEAIPRLTELWYQASELRVEARLHLGRDPQLVAEARQLAVEAPLREHPQALLIRALYQSGRRAEALEAYQDARSVLVEELGCQPGPELQALHQEILEDSPVPVNTAPAAGRRQVPVPRELPAAVASFIGRDTELGALDALLRDTSAGTPPTMLITAIGGTAGVGKTALAVYWAHRVTELFPDGQLYVNLRGYDPGQPLSAADALAGFLCAMGTRGQDIPADEGERAARYRSLLAGRRMLIVLDNARDADQVRPLLPGTHGSAAIVTSRDALTGLVARDGARRLDLDVLPLEDAVRLLRALIGPRVDSEPESAIAVATACCRLPLALRVAAELAASRPVARLADLAAELADQQHRLALLDAGGDLHAAVRSVFSWSCRHLDPAAGRAFRLLGEHPGTSFNAQAVAALADVTVVQARHLLDLLRRAYLVQPAGPGRYSQHDLLRDYAREFATVCDSPAERRAAQARLIDYYLHAAAAAMDALFPGERDTRPRPPGTATRLPVPPDGPTKARAWLDSERANVIAVAGLAAGHRSSAHAAQLAGTMFRYLDSGGHYAEGSAIHTHARRAASQVGDVAAEAHALTNMAIAEARQGNHPQATGHLREALGLSREAGDRGGQARALGNLGIAHLRQGRYRDAITHLQDALALFRETGNRSGEARLLGNLGLACLRMGQYQQATDHLERSLAISREIGSLPSEARALTNLADVEMREGHHRPATAHLQLALTLFRQAGDRVGEAYALTSLGDLNRRLGYHQRATSCHQQACTQFRELADRSGEAAALNGLAEVLLATGHLRAACERYTAALELAVQITERYEQARAHSGLASTCRADSDGDNDQAWHHCQQALELYTQLAAPEADQIRTRLSAIAQKERSDRLRQ